MKTIFKLTNHNSELVSEGEEIIGIGFANRGPFEILNTCSVDYDTLRGEEKEIADAFIDMMRTKMLACGGSDDGSLGLGGES